MPRLLILCEFPTLLGGERSMLSTLRRVADAGFELLVACPSCGPLAAELARLAVPTVPFNTQSSDGRRPALSQRREALHQLIGHCRPDLVHANSLSMARLAGPVTRDLGVPGLGHLRDIIKLTPSAVGDLNCNRQLVAVSLATYQYHVSQGLSADRCRVLHNGVDTDLFRPRSKSGYLHHLLQLQPGERLLVSIGQIGLRKATDIALQAFSLVAEHEQGIHWLVVGERTSTKRESQDFESRLRSTAAAPSLAGRVHFLGLRADIPRLLPECELLVHAAYQEPLGRVLLEAAAAGVAVVATDVGGTGEIFPNESHGALLVPAGDAHRMAAAVSDLLGDPARRQRIGQGGRERAINHFNTGLASAAMIELYKDMLS